MTPPEIPSLREPVALFPLPNVVLFPRTTVPLQIFEPRYRAMVCDALRSDGLIAMAMLRPGYEGKYYTNVAEISPIVCVGHIREHVKTSDGRYLINLTGLCRARVQEEDRDGEYRLATLEPIIPPHAAVTTDGEFAARHALQRVTQQPLLRQLPNADRCESLLQSQSPLSDLVDLIAAMLLPADEIEIRQQLLEELEVIARANCLVAHLDTLNEALERQQRQLSQWPRFGSMN
jgi:Lon protease-like protein